MPLVLLLTITLSKKLLKIRDMSIRVEVKILKSFTAVECLVYYFLQYCMLDAGCDVKLSSGHLRQRASYLLGQSHNSHLKTPVNKVPYVKSSAYVKLLLICHLLSCTSRWPCVSIYQILLLRHVVVWFHFQKNVFIPRLTSILSISDFTMSTFAQFMVRTFHVPSV